MSGQSNFFAWLMRMTNHPNEWFESSYLSSKYAVDPTLLSSLLDRDHNHYKSNNLHQAQQNKNRNVLKIARC